MLEAADHVEQIGGTVIFDSTAMTRRRTRRPQPTTDARSPEQRLEALVREQNRDRAVRSFRRIRDDLDAQPEAVRAWIDGARVLTERLVIGEDAFLYLAEMFLEAWTAHDAAHDPELCRLHDEMDAMERAAGLTEDETWLVHEAPDDWRARNDQWNARSLALTVERLRAWGYAETADLWEQKPNEFDRRTNKGRIEVLGPDPELDAWVEGMLDRS